MRSNEPIQTKHPYKGYDIRGTYYQDRRDGPKKRTYTIQKNGNYTINAGDIIPKLKDAKEIVDELIKESVK